jgi:hypothetical protein
MARAALECGGFENPLFTKPTTGIAVCCARAASGHATAAPPSLAISSRRPMVTGI